VYDVRHKEKDDARRSIRNQYSDNIIHGSVKLKFVFYMAIPKSSSKSAKESMALGNIPHLKKPDVSNLIKFAEDILKEIVLIDDSIVTKIVASKQYSEDPRTEITITF
jgi:Holliday junction resolvase RusA-like endonuclease